MTYLHFFPKSKQAYIHHVGNLCNLARPFKRYCKLFSAEVAVVFWKYNFSQFSPRTNGMYVLKRRMTIFIGVILFLPRTERKPNTKGNSQSQSRLEWGILNSGNQPEMALYRTLPDLTFRHSRTNWNLATRLLIGIISTYRTRLTSRTGNTIR